MLVIFVVLVVLVLFVIVVAVAIVAGVIVYIPTRIVFVFVVHYGSIPLRWWFHVLESQ